MNMDVSSNKYSDYNYYGAYINNYVMAKPGIQEDLIIFKEKSFIPSFVFDKEKQFIIFLVVQNDTNNDEILTNEVQKSLFIYSIDKENLSEVNIGDKLLLKIQRKHNFSEIHVIFADTINSNRRFDQESEPENYWKLNLDDQTLTQLVSNETLNKLQQIVDK